jgi:hypothetical protein
MDSLKLKLTVAENRLAFWLEQIKQCQCYDPDCIHRYFAREYESQIVEFSTAIASSLTRDYECAPFYGDRMRWQR